MNKMILWAAFAVSLVACAPGGDLPDEGDMAADVGGDAKIDPLDCYALDLDACRANSTPNGGPCQPNSFIAWNEQEGCYQSGLGEGVSVCLIDDLVYDSAWASVVDPDGVCWGSDRYLVPPPGWTFLMDSSAGTPCSCVAGTEIIEGCNKPWRSCGDPDVDMGSDAGEDADMASDVGEDADMGDG